jgi:hypothetical protein
MKFRVFWEVASCSHVVVYRRFRGAYSLHHQGDSWLHCATSQKTKLHTRHRENLKSHNLFMLQQIANNVSGPPSVGIALFSGSGLDGSLLQSYSLSTDYENIENELSVSVPDVNSWTQHQHMPSLRNELYSDLGITAVPENVLVGNRYRHIEIPFLCYTMQSWQQACGNIQINVVMVAGVSCFLKCP